MFLILAVHGNLETHGRRSEDRGLNSDCVALRLSGRGLSGRESMQSIWQFLLIDGLYEKHLRARRALAVLYTTSRSGDRRASTFVDDPRSGQRVCKADPSILAPGGSRILSDVDRQF